MNLQQIKKIAVFRALYLGDMLCIIPTVRALRHGFPDAHISLIGLPWQRDFVNRYSNYFNEFIAFPGWPGLPEQPLQAEATLNFLQGMQQQKFDLVLQMQGNGAITNAMCMLWNATYVTGLRRQGDYCPDEKLFLVSDDFEHEILRFLKLTDALGIERQGEHLEFPFMKNEAHYFESIRAQLNLQKSFICIHAGARDPQRRWPIEKFAFIANNLLQRDFQIVLTGSGAEKKLLHELTKQIERPVINIVESLGDIPLGELASIINNSALLVSNDTGVSHIASALSVRSVIIFSPFSEIRRWAPLNKGLHTTVTFDQAESPEYVLHCVLDQLEKHSLKVEHQVSFQV